MITLNLLPDIKKDYLKAKRTKRMFMTIAFFMSTGAIASVVLMSMYVFGVQNLLITSDQHSIDDSIKTLTSVEDLDKIVSVQNQLRALPGLHEDKPAATKLFGYLATITPNSVSLNSINIKFEDNVIEAKGIGEDFKAVNTFVDTLKNANYTYKDGPESQLAFSNVVLDTIGVNKDESSFKVLFEFEPDIFDNNLEGLKLTVPNITSTRSETEKPKSLFDSPKEGEQQ